MPSIRIPDAGHFLCRPEAPSPPGRIPAGLSFVGKALRTRNFEALRNRHNDLTAQKIFQQTRMHALSVFLLIFDESEKLPHESCGSLLPADIFKMKKQLHEEDDTDVSGIWRGRYTWETSVQA